MGYSLIAKKGESPMSHKNRDWSKYNKSLVNRGNIFLWVSPEVLTAWRAKKKKHKLGRPFKFSDTAITTAATLRYVFNLSLRACQGFLGALFKMLKIELDIPCYTQICKRMKKIELPRYFLEKKKVEHIVIDCTGLKVFGEGEWKVKKHGASKHRTWKKLHLAVDEKTQEIIFVDLSSEYVHDTKFVPEIMEHRKGLKRVLMDGIADSGSLYRQAIESGVDLLTPPQKNARKRKEPWFQTRNKRILEIQGLGGDQLARSIWAKLTGYNRRVTVESAIARWKKLFGPFLKSRTWENQRREVSLKSLIINEIKKHDQAVG